MMCVRRGVELMEKEYGKGRIAAFISVHAYSQFWMSPYGTVASSPSYRVPIFKVTVPRDFLLLKTKSTLFIADDNLFYIHLCAMK
jgi:hypothetical protein